jgi:Mg-chelatase subunit ChlD
MNASTLYPYDIVFAWANGINLDNDTEKVKLAQWANMPSIDVGENDAIVVADTSRSMNGRPIATAIGLGLYFAEKNTGIWHNKMITFSEEARYFRLSSKDNVKQKIESLDSIVENTNICSVFELLYNTAIESKATKIPNIIIISDMQFDSGTEGYDETIYEHWRAKFEKAGLNMPNIVYWNVDENNVSFQANSGVRGVQFACGHSINVFKTIMNNIDCTPYQAMIKTLDSKVFDVIRLGGNSSV